MIIEGILNLVFNFFKFILSPFNIPSAPEDLSAALPKFIEYLELGESFFNLFIPINLTPFFIVFLSIFGFKHRYDISMWILRKIPILNIK